MNPRYIVVEGAIGSGKTALSRRLAEHFSALLLSENPDHNPFLIKFYSNVSNNGLAAELFFLMRRAESVNIIEDQCAQGGMVVADFLPEKDRIFTPIVLNDDEQQLFADMKQRILPQYAEPD
ncbi:deoxynucleoside kinase, partial [Neisseria sp. P0021.S007]